MIIELDVSARRAVVDVETPAVGINPGAQEAIGLIIAQGPPGIPGPPGPAGSTFEGTAFWYGMGPPPDVIVGSKPGDYYIDTTTGTLFQLQ